MMVMLPDRERAPLPTRELLILATTLILMMALAHTASAATGNDTTATPIDGTINATPTNATPTATPGAGNTTTNGTAPTTTSPSIGSLVSSIVNVQGVEFRSELSEARFEVEHEEDDETAVSDRLSELKEQERDLLWKKHDLKQAVKEGEMSREEYIVKHAELQAERQSIKRSLATLRSRAGNRAQVETEVQSIERDLDNVSGPATSRLLDSLLAQGGKVEITIERGSVEVKIERGDDLYYERDAPDDENRTRDTRTIGPRAAYDRATEALGDGNWTARKVEADDGEYEIKLYRNGTEAEVKVDARTGAIRELERKTIDDEERDGERKGPERARVPDWAVAKGLDNRTDDLWDDLRDDGNLTGDLRDDLEDDGNLTDTRDDWDDDTNDTRDDDDDDEDDDDEEDDEDDEDDDEEDGDEEDDDDDEEEDD